MKSFARKSIKNILRWGIAVVGIWWVLSNMSWYNRVLIPGPGGWPVAVKLAAPASEDSATFSIVQPDGSIQVLPRDRVLARTDTTRVWVRNERGGADPVDLVAQKVSRLPRNQWDFLVSPPRNIWQRFWNIHPSALRVVGPNQLPHDRQPSLPYPIIESGIGPMLHDASAGLLIAALLVFPIVYFITAYRWHELLKALDIRMTLPRTFVLNMVGAFYNTFLPGSTGGDVAKAYYASRNTTHRTRAVMSVIVDRILGLLALVILGGVMAAVGFFTIPASDPARRKCGQIAIGSAAIIFATIVGLIIFYTPTLRRITGLDWIIQRLPMQRQVHHAIETMEIYRTRPMLVLAAVLMTLPVHATVVISAMLAGMAFHLPLHWLYYWVVVPVVVLAGSIPISPQGAGVMEFFAILLTKRQGCTVSQAFALTMSIRLVQILWNLTGGVFVMRGGFHVPTDAEQHTMDDDEDESGIGFRVSGIGENAIPFPPESRTPTPETRA